MKKTVFIFVLLLTVTLGFNQSGLSAENDTSRPDQFEVAQKDASSKSSQDTNVDEILKKHYDARGGKQAWEKIDNLKFNGLMYTKHATYQTAAIFKRPDICKIVFQGNRIYFIEAYDGSIPWQMNPGTGQKPQILKGKRAKEMIDTCDFDGPLINHKQEGHKIKYLGREKVEERDAYVLEVTFNTGNTDKYYLDAETYLPFMIKGSTSIQDQIVDTTVMVDEYIDIGDINVPFSYEFIVDGNPDTEKLKIKTIELNVDAPDDIFGMPKDPQDLR